MTTDSSSREDRGAPSAEELAEWETLAEQDARCERARKELFAHRVPEITALAADAPLAALGHIADLIARHPDSNPTDAFELLAPEECDWPEALAHRLRANLEQQLGITASGERLIARDVTVRVLRRRWRRPHERSPWCPAMRVELCEPLINLPAGTRLALGWNAWARPALLGWLSLLPGRVLRLDLSCRTAIEFCAGENFAVQHSPVKVA